MFRPDKNNYFIRHSKNNVIYNRSNRMKLGISITGGGALGIGPLQFMRRLEADLGKKLASPMMRVTTTASRSFRLCCP